MLIIFDKHCCGPEKDRLILFVCLLCRNKAQFKRARHEYVWPVGCLLA